MVDKPHGEGPGSEEPLDFDLNFGKAEDQPAPPPARSHDAIPPHQPDHVDHADHEAQHPPAGEPGVDDFIQGMPSSVDEFQGGGRSPVRDDSFEDLTQPAAGRAVLHDPTYEETGGRATDAGFGDHPAAEAQHAQHDGPIENFDPAHATDDQFGEQGDEHGHHAEGAELPEGEHREHQDGDEVAEGEDLLAGGEVEHDESVDEQAPPKSFVSRFGVPLGAGAMLVVVGLVGWNYVVPMFLSAPTAQPGASQTAVLRPQQAPRNVAPPPNAFPQPTTVNQAPASPPPFPPRSQVPQPQIQPQQQVQPLPAPPAQQPVQAAPVTQPQTSPVQQVSIQPQPAAPAVGQPPTGMNPELDPSKALGDRIVGELQKVGQRLDGIERATSDVTRRMDDLEKSKTAGTVAAPKPVRQASVEPVSAEPAEPARRPHAVRSERPRRVASRRADDDADPEMPPSKPRVVSGYSLRGVSEVGGRSIAVIRGKGGKLEEVSVGQSLPGAGEVRAIRQNAGGWVVVTSIGVIVE